jgi:hypothetical protein
MSLVKSTVTDPHWTASVLSMEFVDDLKIKHCNELELLDKDIRRDLIVTEISN